MDAENFSEVESLDRRLEVAAIHGDGFYLIRPKKGVELPLRDFILCLQGVLNSRYMPSIFAAEVDDLRIRAQLSTAQANPVPSLSVGWKTSEWNELPGAGWHDFTNSHYAGWIMILNVSPSFMHKTIPQMVEELQNRGDEYLQEELGK